MSEIRKSLMYKTHSCLPTNTSLGNEENDNQIDKSLVINNSKPLPSRRVMTIERGGGISSSSVNKGENSKGNSSGQIESTETPTPSEKVSRWHRDIFLGTCLFCN